MDGSAAVDGGSAAVDGGSAAVDVDATTKKRDKRAAHLQRAVDPQDPSFLFPPRARVLLAIVISRQRKCRRQSRYVCMILPVRGVRCLTCSTHFHTRQHGASSQPLQLEKVAKAGAKRARSTSPSSARETRSMQRR